jgi:hypothetical protein
MMAEGAVVSCRPVPMCPWLIRCRSGLSHGGDRKLSTSGESTSRKSSDCRAWKSSALGVIPGDGTEVRGRVHMNRGRVGEERGGKEMDGCPLTLPPLQRCGVTMHDNHQEVARSALVKEIESKRAALIWRAVLGYLRWNCAIFGFACTCVCTSH